MTLGAFKSCFLQHLDSYYTQDELSVLFAQLGEVLFNKDRASLHLMGDKLLSKAEQDYLNNAMQRLATFEPIQYIIGHTDFYGLPIQVTPHVLIPRPETEELVDWILSQTQTQNTIESCLDLCTGSGCIAIALASYFKQAQVAAVDLSPDAIDLAKINATNNSVNIDFIIANVLDLAPFANKFDVIVSNPPYVRNSEKQLMKPNVLDFEPHMALFVSNKDPLIFYRAIGEFALKQLKPNGSLFLEINEYLSENLIDLMQNIGFNTIALKKDFNQVPRMLKCKL